MGPAAPNPDTRPAQPAALAAQPAKGRDAPGRAPLPGDPLAIEDRRGLPPPEFPLAPTGLVTVIPVQRPVLPAPDPETPASPTLAPDLPAPASGTEEAWEWPDAFAPATPDPGPRPADAWAPDAPARPAPAAPEGQPGAPANPAARPPGAAMPPPPAPATSNGLPSAHTTVPPADPDPVATVAMPAITPAPDATEAGSAPRPELAPGPVPGDTPAESDSPTEPVSPVGAEQAPAAEVSPRARTVTSAADEPSPEPSASAGDKEHEPGHQRDEPASADRLELYRASAGALLGSTFFAFPALAVLVTGFVLGYQPGPMVGVFFAVALLLGLIGALVVGFISWRTMGRWPIKAAPPSAARSTLPPIKLHTVLSLLLSALLIAALLLAPPSNSGSAAGGLAGVAASLAIAAYFGSLPLRSYERKHWVLLWVDRRSKGLRTFFTTGVPAPSRTVATLRPHGNEQPGRGRAAAPGPASPADRAASGGE